MPGKVKSGTGLVGGVTTPAGQSKVEDDESQRRLHEAASKCLGTLAGRNPHRAESGRQAIRDRLRRPNTP